MLEIYCGLLAAFPLNFLTEQLHKSLLALQQLNHYYAESSSTSLFTFKNINRFLILRRSTSLIELV